MRNPPYDEDDFDDFPGGHWPDEFDHDDEDYDDEFDWDEDFEIEWEYEQ